MRVALYMDAPHIGGAERYFRDLCAGLADSGHEVHVVCPDHVLVPYMAELGDAVTVHALGPRLVLDHGLLGNMVRALPPFLDIRRCLRAIRPDVVHLCNGGYPAAHMCRAAAFATAAPRVMTVNNRARERRPRVRGAEIALDHLMWRALSALICPSQATAERLLEVRDAPRSMLQVIPYGIASPQPDPAEVGRLRSLHAPNGELLVGLVAAPDSSGEHARDKGHGVLLEALAQATRGDIRLVIVGHDPGPEFAARAAQLHLCDRVAVLPGFRDATPYMSAFDLLAVPSTRNEALPLVIIEAMASGRPVLASRLAGIPEAIIDGESGDTVAPGDARALAERLNSYAQDRAGLRAMGERARLRYEDEFSRDRMTARTLAVYARALEADR